MCHIFYYNFSVNFLQSAWIRPKKMLSHNGMIQYTCNRRVYSEGVFMECYCDKALSTNYIPSMNIHEHSKNVIGQLLLAE